MGIQPGNIFRQPADEHALLMRMPFSFHASVSAAERVFVALLRDTLLDLGFTANSPSRLGRIDSDLVALFSVTPLHIDKFMESAEKGNERSLCGLAQEFAGHPGILIECIALNQLAGRQKAAADGLAIAAMIALRESLSKARRYSVSAAEQLPHLSRQAIGAQSAQELQELVRQCGLGNLKHRGEDGGLRLAQQPEFKEWHRFVEAAPRAFVLSKDVRSPDCLELFKALVSGNLTYAAMTDERSERAIKVFNSLTEVCSELVRDRLSERSQGKWIAAAVKEGIPVASIEELLQAARTAHVNRLSSAREQQRQIEETAHLKLLRMPAKVPERTPESEESQRRKAEQAANDFKAKIREFHEGFQAVPLSERAQKMLEVIQDGSSVPREKKALMERFHATVECLRNNLLDLRGAEPAQLGDPAVQQLVDILLSPTNIGATVSAHGVDAQKCLNVDLSTKLPHEATVRELSSLFEASPACRKIILTLMDQGEGIPLLASLLVPPETVRRYVSERHWGAAGALRENNEKRAALAELLRTQLFDATAFRRVRAERGTLPEQQESKAKPIAIPGWLDQVINPVEFSYAVEGACLLVMCRDNAASGSGALPPSYVEIPARFLADRSQFERAYGKKLAELIALSQASEQITELRDRCGFSVSHTRGPLGLTVSLDHHAYEIQEELAGEPQKWGTRLDRLKEEFVAKDKLWEELFLDAQEAGFEVDRSSGEVTLSHPFLRSCRLSAEPYVPVQKLGTVQELIGQAEAAQRRQAERQAHNTRLAALRSASPEDIETMQNEVFPQPGDHILVIDANVFIALSAPRDGGSSWLDLLSETAALKNVRIMIPSIVGDFELLQRVVPFDSGDTAPLKDGFWGQFSRPDRAIEEFLSDASRIKTELDAGGAPSIVRGALGASRKVCLVESPGDAEFLEKVERMYRQGGNDPRILLERLQEEVYGCDAGDSAITRFIQSCPFDNEITVITSDTRYIDGAMPRTTVRGAPVSGCSLGAYLRAELGTRSVQLQESLNENFGVSFDTISGDVEAHLKRLGKRGGYLFPKHLKGIAGPEWGARARSIGKTILEGLDAEQGSEDDHSEDTLS